MTAAPRASLLGTLTPPTECVVLRPGSQMVAFSTRSAVYSMPYSALRSVHWEGPSGFSVQESIRLRFGEAHVTIRGRALTALTGWFGSMAVAWVRPVRPQDLFRVRAGRIDAVEVLLPVSELAPSSWSSHRR